MTVNFRQLSIMTFMSFIALKFLALPSLLYTVSGDMSWLVALVLMIIDGIYAVIIVDLIKKNQKKNVYDFMKSILGPFFAKLILIVLLIKFAIVIANILKGLEFFVVENFYTELNWIVFIAPLIGVISFMIYKGVRNIARVFEMVFIAIIIGLIYIALKSFAGVDLLMFIPFFEFGVQPLFESAYVHLSWFGSASFLIMLFGCVDFKNAKKFNLIRYIFYAIGIVQLLYIVFYGLFDMTSPTHSFALSDVSQYYGGRVAVNELSWLVVSLWVVAQAIQCAMYGFCFVKAVMYIFNIKNSIVPILILDAYMLSWVIAGKNTIKLERFFFSDFASIITIISQYIIPLILLFGYLIKRSRQKRKHKVVKNEEIKVNI
ncbi:MAG: hypothetical protein E7374_01560 [Clostridiales bacterium]|nr:hypothetical protein [Clostridiales bacterium]